MQPASTRLQQAIWTAFKAARPVNTNSSVPHRLFQQPPYLVVQPRAIQVQKQLPQWRLGTAAQIRAYGNQTKAEVDRKVEDAKQRIDETIESRAGNTIHLPGPEE